MTLTVLFIDQTIDAGEFREATACQMAKAYGTEGSETLSELLRLFEPNIRYGAELAGITETEAVASLVEDLEAEGVLWG